MIRHHERHYTEHNSKKHGLKKPPAIKLVVGEKYKLRSVVRSATGKLAGSSIIILKAILGNEVKIESLDGKIWGFANKEQLINQKDQYDPNPMFFLKERKGYCFV